MRRYSISSPAHQIGPVGGHSARQWCSTHRMYADDEQAIATGLWMMATGHSLYEVAVATGRTKEWLRSHGVC